MKKMMMRLNIIYFYLLFTINDFKRNDPQNVGMNILRILNIN